MRLSVVAHKGGVGKTTSAIHLAAYLSRFGRTLLIDGDPGRNAHSWSQRGESGPPKPFVTHAERQGEREAHAFDHVVYDTQARLNDDDKNDIVSVSTFLVLPTSPEMFAVEMMFETANDYERLGVPRSRMRVVLTLVPPYPFKTDEVREDIAAAGLHVVASEIPRLSVFTKVSMSGLLVSDIAADRQAARAWEAYAQAAQEVTGLGQIHQQREGQ